MSYDAEDDLVTVAADASEHDSVAVIISAGLTIHDATAESIAESARGQTAVAGCDAKVTSLDGEAESDTGDVCTQTICSQDEAAEGSECKLTISTAIGEPFAESSCEQVVEECPICFEEPTRRIELPCGHAYCADCLLKCIVQYGKRTCPTCRGELFSGQEPAAGEGREQTFTHLNSFDFNSSLGNVSRFSIEMYNGNSVTRTFSYQSSDDTSLRSDSSRIPAPLRGLHDPAAPPHVFDEPQEFMHHLSRRGLRRSSRGRGSFSLSSSSFDTLPDFHTAIDAGAGGDVTVGRGFSFSDLPKWLFGLDCCQPVLRSAADPRRYIKCSTRPLEPRVRPFLSERSTISETFFTHHETLSS